MKNLLAPHHKKRLARMYLARVGVVGLALFALVLVVALLFLLPPLLFIEIEERRLARVLAQEEERATPSESAHTTLARAQEVLTQANWYQQFASPTELITAVLDARPEGVRIDELSLVQEAPSAAVEAVSPQLLVHGTAQTRDALVIFTDELEAHARIQEVEVPLRDFAQRSESPFTATVTFFPK